MKITEQELLQRKQRLLKELKLLESEILEAEELAAELDDDSHAA